MYYTVDKIGEGKGDSWKGGIGYVTREMASEHIPPPSDDNLVLVCGPPPMYKALSGEKKSPKDQGRLQHHALSSLPSKQRPSLKLTHSPSVKLSPCAMLIPQQEVQTLTQHCIGCLLLVMHNHRPYSAYLTCGLVQRLFPMTCRRVEWTVEGNGIHRAASVQILTVHRLSTYLCQTACDVRA